MEFRKQDKNGLSLSDKVCIPLASMCYLAVLEIGFAMLLSEDSHPPQVHFWWMQLNFLLPLFPNCALDFLSNGSTFVSKKTKLQHNSNREANS